MITVGLINELRFISKALRTPISASIKSEKTNSEIHINIKEQILNISYLGYLIWTESLDDTITMFGVESCDSIARIVLLVDSGDTEQWRKLVFKDK